MSNLIQLRRGTTAQRLAMILASGEPGWDTDLRQLFIGDGATYGGYPLYPNASFKNKFINGNFDFWQRATSRAAAAQNIYTADRWKVIGIGTTVAPSQQLFALGQTAVPFEPTYYHRIVVASVAGANNLAVTQQSIEGVRTLAGRTCTLSFYAKADAAKNMAIELTQIFGTGGSPSASNQSIGSQLVALTTNWAKYAITIAVPTIAGKTLGTNGDDTLQLNFWFDAGNGGNLTTRSANLGQQSGTFDIAQVQIEDGSTATPFEIRPPQLELALCQRYYEKSYDVGTAPGTVTQAGNSVAVLSPLASAVWRPGTMVYFKVTKRASPTVTILSPATGVAGNARDFASGVDVAAAVNNTGCSAFLWIASNSAAVTQYNLQTHWTADAEL